MILVNYKSTDSYYTEMSEPEIKKCTNHIRGCRVILEEDYTKKKCAECLRKERERDHKKRHAVDNLIPADENNKICSVCCKEFPLDHFQGVKLNTTTKSCQSCRDDNKKQDLKRDKDHRNELDRIASKKPERIAVKKEWAANNYEKRAES